MESLRLFKYSRTSTFILLNKIDKDFWDEQPNGFPNTVRWNAGHIFTTAEDFLHDADRNYQIHKPEWIDLFIDGTSPNDWQTELVPSPEEIITALKEQEVRITNYFSDKLQNEASIARDVNGMALATVDHALQFVTWHEGIHLGVMNGLNKIFALQRSESLSK